jgi:hypothetical protein
MNIEQASSNIGDQDRSENGAAEDELQTEAVDSNAEPMEQESEFETDGRDVGKQALEQPIAGITGKEFQGALSAVGAAVRSLG